MNICVSRFLPKHGFTNGQVAMFYITVEAELGIHVLLFTLAGPFRSFPYGSWRHPFVCHTDYISSTYRHFMRMAAYKATGIHWPPCLIITETYSTCFHYNTSLQHSIAILTAREASPLNPSHWGSLMPSSPAELSDISFEMRSAQKLPTWL